MGSRGDEILGEGCVIMARLRIGRAQVSRNTQALARSIRLRRAGGVSGGSTVAVRAPGLREPA